ncbi:hypothetical protein D1007_13582 [Hordeum vulgare]|nr:hypothetical protein D1007_13582 [Hordeum vulgare]
MSSPLPPLLPSAPPATTIISYHQPPLPPDPPPPTTVTAISLPTASFTSPPLSPGGKLDDSPIHAAIRVALGVGNAMGADFEDQVWSAILQPITPFRHKSSGIHLMGTIERAVLKIDSLMLGSYLQGCIGGQSDLFMSLQLSPSEFHFTVSSVPVALAILWEAKIDTPPIHISFLPCSIENVAKVPAAYMDPRILVSPLHQPAPPLDLARSAFQPMNIGDRMQHAFRFIHQTLKLGPNIGLLFQSALWRAKRSMLSPPRHASSRARDTIIFFHNCHLPLDCFLVAALLF